MAEICLRLRWQRVNRKFMRLWFLFFFLSFFSFSFSVKRRVRGEVFYRNESAHLFILNYVSGFVINGRLTRCERLDLVAVERLNKDERLHLGVRPSTPGSKSRRAIRATSLPVSRFRFDLRFIFRKKKSFEFAIRAHAKKAIRKSLTRRLAASGPRARLSRASSVFPASVGESIEFICGRVTV